MVGVGEIQDLSLEKASKISEFEKHFQYTGFQASKLSEAISLLKKMKQEGATIFLAFTANMVASGLRGTILELLKKGYADVIITTGGAIDHDLIRTQLPYIKGSFSDDDISLHKKGINRLGDILIPNDRYEALEKLVAPLYKSLYEAEKVVTPSRLIAHLGENLKSDDSIFSYCAEQNIPVYCPGITDSALGLQLYFFNQDYLDFKVDVVGDLKPMIGKALNSEKTGALILGGGISKHHTLGANLLRDGLDYTVYVTTAHEFDGSLSGAATREAKSWGKLGETGESVTVHCEASIALPLIVAGV